MRCELTPCPQCGKRRLDTFVKGARNTMLILIAFVVVVALVVYASDTREFMHGLDVYLGILGGVLVFMLGIAGIMLVFEFRSAPRNVRFVDHQRGPPLD